MVLIYSHINTNRLQYICNFIFNEQLQTQYSITIDSEEFKKYSGTKINYSNLQLDGFTLNPTSNLLFESNITHQTIECFTTEKYKAFFKTTNPSFPFDIFAASFYLISRYEEYLPHTKDMYGRYAHENSLAYKESFLEIPLINIWIKDFAKTLKENFSTFNYQLSTFNYQPTYDIDIAYSYKHKGILRNVGAFAKKPTLERVKVLLGLQKDPFDSYAWMNELHDKNNLQPIYFFLVAQKNSTYDKNILLDRNAMWQLIKYHAKKYKIGVHPSWQSGDEPMMLKKEKSYLESMSEISVTKSRQHYIRFYLPEGYQRLINIGITDDYSMGYGTINGFRASVASSFFWFDIEKNEQTYLRIHPFCFMDANSHYEQKQNTEASYKELLHYYRVCKENNGTLVTIFHNNFLGTDSNLKGWKDMYEKFVTTNLAT